MMSFNFLNYLVQILDIKSIEVDEYRYLSFQCSLLTYSDVVANANSWLLNALPRKRTGKIHESSRRAASVFIMHANAE